MSIAIIKIPNNNLPIFRKLMKALDARISIVKDEDEYEKRIMLHLIEESENSANVSEETVRKDFRKYGVGL